MPKKSVTQEKNADKDVVLRVMDRISELRDFRAKQMANPYDNTKKARTVEETWDYADYVTLPHKFSTPEMQDWMSDNSIPLIMSKIDTALSVIVAKNPEVEISGRTDRYDRKAKILKALYDLSWDKGNGRQQLRKFVYNAAKYGTAIAREYHKFQQEQVDEIVAYDPEGNHRTEKKLITLHDEPILEVIPIRDAYLDDRALPFDEDSIRDWAWCVEYDMSTFQKVFRNYNIGKVKTSLKDKRDKADLDVGNRDTVRVWFYENKQTNEFILTDGIELIHKGLLLNGDLSLVLCIWKLRNDFCVYGIGIPEQLEHNQTMLDRIVNMTLNQTMLTIGGAGWYGGTGNLNTQDMILEPRLKKLRDVDKLEFPKIPSPDSFVLEMIQFILDQADEISGITKSLGGEQVGKTLGEAVLNREAGLRRLALPLQNVEFAMERHAELRINNIQLIYGRPVTSEIIKDLSGVVNPKLWEKYQEERGKMAGSVEFDQKYPTETQMNPETGTEEEIVYKNNYKTEKLPFEKDKEGEIEPSGKGMYLEITPEEIRGEYDISVKAMSTIPMSQTLREAQAMETYSFAINNPFTDAYKALDNVLKARNIDPDLWLKDEQSIIETQQQAMQAPPGTSFDLDVGGKPMQKVPTSPGAIPSQISKDLGM